MANLSLIDSFSFLWETFMLKHFVDEGELKQVGDILTPWPCFMIAVRNDVVERDPDLIARLFDAITYCAQLFYQEKQESLQFISQSCHLHMEDAENWYKTVQFAENTRKISEKVLQETKQILIRAKVLDKDADVTTIYNTSFSQVD
jgi:sulfonate transport system substrate-binding protein